jgi:hypothetical protein
MAVPPNLAASASERSSLRYRRTSITGARVVGSTTAELAEAVWMHPLSSVRIWVCFMFSHDVCCCVREPFISNYLLWDTLIFS